MRIGIYDPYLDDLGGGEKYMMTIAQILSKKNDVHIFWDNPEDLKPLKERFNIDLSKVKLTKNIFSDKVSFMDRLLKSRRYDEILVLSDGSIPLLLSKKLFIHIQQPLQNVQSKNLKNKIKLAKVNLFLCNSEYTKAFVDKKFVVKTEILYPPVDLKPEKVNKENIILHVGRFRVKNVGLDDYKKQRVMANVFREMVDSGLKNWKFVLAVSIKEEDTSEFDEFRKKLVGYPIEFLINKSNNELWSIYSKAKIYWHASGYGENLNTHPEFAEHFGISTVEAMGAGVVPVVINAGGQKEIVTDGENGFLWDTLDELKKKTLELVENEKLLEKMSINAEKKSKEFSGDRFKEQVERILG